MVGEDVLVFLTEEVFLGRLVGTLWHRMTLMISSRSNFGEVS